MTLTVEAKPIPSGYDSRTSFCAIDGMPTGTDCTLPAPLPMVLTEGQSVQLTIEYIERVSGCVNSCSSHLFQGNAEGHGGFIDTPNHHIPANDMDVTGEAGRAGFIVKGS